MQYVILNYIHCNVKFVVDSCLNIQKYYTIVVAKVLDYPYVGFGSDPNCTTTPNTTPSFSCMNWFKYFACARVSSLKNVVANLWRIATKCTLRIIYARLAFLYLHTKHNVHVQCTYCNSQIIVCISYANRFLDACACYANGKMWSVA